MSAPLLHKKAKLLPSGDQCLIVEFGTGVDVALNAQACGFATQVMAQGAAFISDVVPSFTTVALHYRPEALPTGTKPLASLMQWVQGLLDEPANETGGSGRLIEIPVCYGGEYGPDLIDVAKHSGASVEDIVAQHLGLTAQVFMLGFAPGLPYAGLWGEAFALPRRSTPRTKVPAGTVAIANRQCVIYPFDLPGGWHLIGRTPLRLFDPRRSESPALLSPGDQMKFRAITPEEFMDLASA